MAPRDRVRRSRRVVLFAGKNRFAFDQLHYSLPPRGNHVSRSNLLPGKPFGVSWDGRINHSRRSLRGCEEINFLEGEPLRFAGNLEHSLRNSDDRIYVLPRSRVLKMASSYVFVGKHFKRPKSVARSVSEAS